MISSISAMAASMDGESLWITERDGDIPFSLIALKYPSCRSIKLGIR